MFTKIFLRIFDSSIADDYRIRHLFMDLLVLADRDGCLDMTVGSIARRTGIPKEDVQRFIDVLSEPDPESRSKEEGGRRLVPLSPEQSWGWRIVNYQKYRETSVSEMLRMGEAQRKRLYRVNCSRSRKGLPLLHDLPPEKVSPTPLSKTDAEAEALHVPDKTAVVPDKSGTCPGHVRDKGVRDRLGDHIPKAPLSLEKAEEKGPKPSTTPISIAERISLEDELKELKAELHRLENAYDDHMDPPRSHFADLKKVKVRLQEIKAALGRVV